MNGWQATARCRQIHSQKPTAKHSAKNTAKHTAKSAANSTANPTTSDTSLVPVALLGLGGPTMDRESQRGIVGTAIRSRSSSAFRPSRYLCSTWLWGRRLLMCDLWTREDRCSWSRCLRDWGEDGRDYAWVAPLARARVRFPRLELEAGCRRWCRDSRHLRRAKECEDDREWSWNLRWTWSRGWAGCLQLPKCWAYLASRTWCC